MRPNSRNKRERTAVFGAGWEYCLVPSVSHLHIWSPGTTVSAGIAEKVFTPKPPAAPIANLTSAEEPPDGFPREAVWPQPEFEREHPA